MNLSVRPERREDFVAIDQVVRAAFDSEVQPTLVGMIRESSNYVAGLSLVAEAAGAVVGHIMLSHVDLEDGSKRHRVLTLSPVAVIPAAQRQGIGTALIKAAIRAADSAGEPVVVLEGDPDYYSRFGFQPAGEFDISIDLPPWAPLEAAQVIPFSNYDSTIKGKVAYPPAFEHAEGKGWT